MANLTPTERDALDNACARLRETKMGTKIGNIEDFLDIDVLTTEADTVSDAINELNAKWANPLLNVQVPPPGFFTLVGDEEGNLWCFCNDEDNPPLFEHDTTTGNIYLYIASEDGPNSYKVLVGNFIPVQSLEDYYEKSEIDSMLTPLEDAIDSLVGFTAVIVDELPTTGDLGKMYLILSDSGEEGDIYDEYIWVNNAFEKIGSTATELSFTVDSTLSDTSENPVQNKIIKAELDSLYSAKANISHVHSIADINNLQSTLNSKASTSHNHSIVDITGLQEQLTSLSSDIATIWEQLSSEEPGPSLDIGESLSTGLEIGSTAYMLYIKESADWFLSPNGSDSNTGTSESLAFRTFAPLVSKASPGDIVYVESGTYTHSTEIKIPVSVSIYGNPYSPPIISSSTSDTYSLALVCSSNNSINIENLHFQGNTSLTYRRLLWIEGSTSGSNSINVQNCKFENARTAYNGCALHIANLPTSSSIATVSDCTFLNNTTTSYGHSGASCQLANSYGSLKVYRCVFNNPLSGNNYFCAFTGQSIAVHTYGNTCNASGTGSCNQFLGEGDTCRVGYTELECE